MKPTAPFRNEFSVLATPRCRSVFLPRQTSKGMTYHDGSPISLGDIVRVTIPGGTAKARVVMLGDCYEHLEIDKQFLAWVERDRVLEASSVVVEWLESNPFAHTDPRYAPVANYNFCDVDDHLESVRA